MTRMDGKASRGTKVTGWVIQGLNLRRGTRFSSSPKQPDLLWAHPATYSMAARGFIPGSKAAGT